MSDNVKNTTKRKAGSSNEIRSMLHDTWVLFAITLIAGIILGFVFQITKEPISLQEEKAKNESSKKETEQPHKNRTFHHHSAVIPIFPSP